MPLSEHEKRLLDEIEQTLLTDDPGLASSLRSARPQRRTRTLVALAVGAFIAGIALISIGLRQPGVAVTVLGVVGFAFIVAGTDCALRVGKRIRTQRRHSRRAAPAGNDEL
jgi:hypothetical protein